MRPGASGTRAQNPCEAPSGLALPGNPPLEQLAAPVVAPSTRAATMACRPTRDIAPSPASPRERGVAPAAAGCSAQAAGLPSCCSLPAGHMSDLSRVYGRLTAPPLPRDSGSPCGRDWPRVYVTPNWQHSTTLSLASRVLRRRRQPARLGQGVGRILAAGGTAPPPTGGPRSLGVGRGRPSTGSGPSHGVGIY